MFEELNERRKAVERNIAKSFGTDDDVLELEKAIEDEFEKGRAKKTFAIGDTFTRHGITYKCTGISANTGRPTWSKMKDGGSNTKENKSNEELDISQKQERAKILEFYKKYEDFRNEIETNLGEVDVNEIPFKTLKREFESWYEDAQYVIKKQQNQSDKKEEKEESEKKEDKKEEQSKSKGDDRKEEQRKKKEELSFEEIKDAISEYFNSESVKEGTVHFDRDTLLFISKKYNSVTKRYEAIVENINGRRASSKEDVEQVLRRYFDELKQQNKIKYNKDKGNKKQEKTKKEIKKKESVKLTKKDIEEIEDKINKFKYKGSDGWTEDRNRLPYDFELGNLEDGTINLYGYGKAYGDSKTITDEFTYNRGKQYTMWYRGQPSNYWYAEPKQQLANNVILWLKEKGVLNEDNYKSFKVKIRIELD